MLLAGRTLPLNGIRFRQDNDFYYLTGNEDTNAVLAIDAPSGDSWLFLPPQNASEVRSDGKNWLTMGDQAKPRGFTTIAPITELAEFLARRRAGGAGRPLYTRLSERDEVDDSRGEQGVGLARRHEQPAGRAAQRRCLARRIAAAALPRRRAQGRHAGHRPAARDQVAARDRNPDAQRPV